MIMFRLSPDSKAKASWESACSSRSSRIRAPTIALRAAQRRVCSSEDWCGRVGMNQCHPTMSALSALLVIHAPDSARLHQVSGRWKHHNLGRELLMSRQVPWPLSQRNPRNAADLDPRRILNIPSRNPHEGQIVSASTIKRVRERVGACFGMQARLQVDMGSSCSTA